MANRNLIDYLPQFVQDYLEMQKIMSAEQIEINNLWTAADNTFNDQFVLDATENGVSRWESILAITPKGTDTLNERKYRILTILNQQLPYTITRLQEVLTTLCGADGYEIELTASTYNILVKIALANKNNFADVSRVLEQMIPANMVKVIQIMYNTHEILSEYTHAQLASYTHFELREEVMT